MYDIERCVILHHCTESGHVVIPDDVTEIGEKCFQHEVQPELWNSGTMIPNSTVESIVIPDSVVKVGSQAFAVCDHLTEVELPAMRFTSGEEFAYCSALKTVSVRPRDGFDTIIEFSKEMFQKCSSLEEIVLPKHGGVLNERCFMCTGIKEIVIPEDIKLEGYGHFVACQSLTKAVINCQQVAMNMFSDCINLKYVELNNTKTIGMSAFTRCSSLEEITLPPTVTDIRHGAFRWCNNLRRINVYPELFEHMWMDTVKDRAPDGVEINIL